MNQPLSQETITYLLTLERGISGGFITAREGLQRAFDAGRLRGRTEGIGQAQDILAGKEQAS